jgi:protein-tyrosine phosphatase
MKILMVCLGNICRSPLAEGILQYKVQKNGLQWIVESAGTGAWHLGQPPHRLSQKVALKNGIDISGQRCRLFRKEDMLHFNRIYVMDKENYNDVKMMSGELWEAGKVDLLLNELYPGEDRAVPDPYYGAEADYLEVFDLVSRACDKIILKYANPEKQQSTTR